MKELKHIEQLLKFEADQDKTGRLSAIEFVMKSSTQAFQLFMWKKENNYEPGVNVYHLPGKVDCPICYKQEDYSETATRCEAFITNDDLKKQIIEELKYFPQGRLRLLFASEGGK